jgi:hypothetical protein
MPTRTAVGTYRLREQEVVVLRLDPQILENGVGPEALHVVPVLDLTMPDRIPDAISRVVTSN